MMKQKKLLAVALCLLLLVIVGGCGSGNTGSAGDEGDTGDAGGDAQEIVKIAYLPITHAIPLFAAAERVGTDSAVKIELVKYSSWSELTDALNTGRVDGASVLIQLAAKSKEQGVGLKAVALGHRDGNVVIVKPEIDSAADLKGRTFAIPHRQSSHNILLQQMLSDAGLSIEDVNVVELAPPEMPSALAQGQIDGYCVAEPFGAKAVTLGVGKALYESNTLWHDSICCSLVLTDDFIDKHPETARAFADQYRAAGDAIARNRDDATLAAEKYLTVDADTLALSLQWIQFDKLEITQQAYGDLTDKMVKFGLSENPPKYEDFVANLD